MLGITEILQKYPSEVSGGQKQRSAARALVHEPAIILGDEPTGALDSKNATSLLDAMTNLNKDQGVSIMMVTHDPYSASYCQRILFIQDGELYKEIHRGGTREEFYKRNFRCACGLRHTKSVRKEVLEHVIQTFHVRAKE